MGLFGDIARAAANAAVDAAKDKATEAVSSSLGRIATPKREVTFCGNSERQIYTYYGKPLKRVRQGDCFIADVVTKPIKLTSELTGGVWDTAAEGVALAYKGKVFGATSALGTTFKNLVRRGYKVKVGCTMVGWYAPGIPEILMTIPDPNEIFAWLDDCEHSGEEVSFDVWKARR